MFIYSRKVFLKNTDATGGIYFTALLDYAVEAFEMFLSGQGKDVQWLFSQKYFFPIVHAEADYFSPLRVGDEIQVQLQVKEIKNRSFSLEANIVHLADKAICGKVALVHAFVAKQEGKSEPTPQEVLALLKQL